MEILENISKLVESKLRQKSEVEAMMQRYRDVALTRL